MNRWSLVGCVLLAAVGTSSCAEAVQREPVVGLPCEGCESVFVGLPSDVPSTLRLIRDSEPGEPLRIEGIVRDPAGDPAPGVILYLYHTNDRGVYPEDPALRGTPAERHGRLRGWVRTDTAGRYVVETIRPGAYPNGTEPQHVHMHVLEPGRCTYYISSIHFLDDPRLPRPGQQPRGGPARVRPHRTGDGWEVTRDIVLGENVTGYGGCGEDRAP